ncbi:MAG: acyl carrier protein [Muribaculaceae bacterium]|nr:acyl carrier protein [Muribaculaceae bacterium]
MTQQEKIYLLEDLFELEEGTLKLETSLEDIETYDSMSKLSLIVMFDDEFDKKLTGEKIQTFKTVKDILDFME